MNSTELNTIAQALVAPGKGILAADESTATITKRFKTIDVASTEETRCAYREMLTTTEGLGEFISGVILFDETIRQKTRDGISITDVLRKQDIIPGIKVDKGAKALANFPGEKVTEGLDGLRERLAEYRKLGARFTKWRAVLSIGREIPSPFGIRTNAQALARFAALSQEADLVPIVEPEVLMNGNHTIEQCQTVTEATLKIVFEELSQHKVGLGQMLLKASMVLPGKDCPKDGSVEEVAEKTLATLLRTVPDEVPGVVFLSGGQSDQQATEHLNALNKIDHAPWELSFSFGRALQSAAMQLWKGSEQNVQKAQEALYYRAKCNSLARYGHYFSEMEKNTEAASTEG